MLCQCFWRAGVPKTALQFAPCSGGTVGAATRHARRRRRRDPHRRHRNRRQNVAAQTDDASARRNGRQERDHRHRAFRPRPGHQERAPQRVQPQRPEVLGHVAADSRKRGLSRRHASASSSATPSRASPSARRGTSPPKSARSSGRQPARSNRRSRNSSPAKSGPSCRGSTSTTIRNLVSPGVKWGVQPGSFTHCTEFFGPMLAVMEARDLDAAIDLVNATGYGLTSGLESLDDREHELWQQPHPRRQFVHQSTDDRRDRASPALRRHGQKQRRPRHQSRRSELRRPADDVLRRGSKCGRRPRRRNRAATKWTAAFSAPTSSLPFAPRSATTWQSPSRLPSPPKTSTAFS